VSVEHKDTHAHDSSHSHEEEHGHGDIEPVVVKMQSPNQELAEEMKKSGVDCEAMAPGSHPLERKPYYSQMFALSSRYVTNKGLVKLRGRNIDFMQVLQRS
jgi:hypothetical protein